MDQIKDIIQNVIGKISSEGFKDQTKIYEIWQKIVGEAGIKHTCISGLKDKTLLVLVDSSAWLFQMSLQRKKILEQIQKEKLEIQKIVFKIGKV